VPAVATGLLQIRVRDRAVVAISAFRAGVLGLAGATSSALFHQLAGPGPASWLVHPAAVAAAVACAALFAAVVGLLAGVAAHLRDPLAGWRDLLRDSESMLLDVTGLCAGVLVTIACSVSPALLAVALPPVVLLQPGIVADVEDCDPEWCRVEVRNYRGWLRRDEVWGLYPDEIIK